MATCFLSLRIVVDSPIVETCIRCLDPPVVAAQHHLISFQNRVSHGLGSNIGYQWIPSECRLLTYLLILIVTVSLLNNLTVAHHLYYFYHAGGTGQPDKQDYLLIIKKHMGIPKILHFSEDYNVRFWGQPLWQVNPNITLGWPFPTYLARNIIGTIILMHFLVSCQLYARVLSISSCETMITTSKHTLDSTISTIC